MTAYDKEHPLRRFWVEKSGWYSSNSKMPELGMAEGTLCINTWNAAIQAAAEIASDVEADPILNRDKIEALQYKENPR